MNIASIQERLTKSIMIALAALLAVPLSLIIIQVRQADAASIWAPTSTPSVVSAADTGSVELGTKFRSSVATTVTGVKFYKAAENTGTHTGSLWASDGTQLATVTFTNESTSGWQQAYFSAPVAITADTTYVVSYHAPNGRYSFDQNYFSGASYTNGTLTALQDGLDGGNGVYSYSSSTTFPSQTYLASNYWVDVITTETPDTTPPTVTITAPANNDSVSGSVTITADASDNEAVSSVAFMIDGSTIQSDSTSPYSVTWDSASVANGVHTLSAIASDTSGNTTTSTAISVTTSNTQPSTTSIWSSSDTPSSATTNDPSAVELGLKFRSTEDTNVVGVKFYKGTGNTGTHTGNLWDTAGNNLASVTFTGETASGWQEATFTAPVAITANTTYVVSYHAPNGNYAADGAYFAGNTVTSGILTALDSGSSGGNGVYLYGGGGYPNQTFNATNYWVDVVVGDANDTTPPTVSGTIPNNNAIDVATDTIIEAVMSEPLNSSSVSSSTVTLTDSNLNPIPMTVGYTATSNTITITPANALANDSTYVATVTSGVEDSAGNALAADFSWTFTTQADNGGVDPLAQGNGGPILLITKSDRPFSAYMSEILRAEGYNSFNTVDISAVSAVLLDDYQVVVLGDLPLTTTQVTDLTDWVNNDGGNLITMRPDKQLSGLLGLTDQSATLSDAYLQVDTSQAPGQGIVSDTIQYHGDADLYTTQIGTETIATLFSDDITSTSNPAVVHRSVGANGGDVVAFTYDLGRSVVYTHQGNPAWSGDERDGSAPIRPNDLFYGAKVGDVQPDYIDLDKVAIPQADEQQRLFANIINDVNADNQPLPKFGYFPYNDKAVVVLAADDHATSTGTINALDYQLAQSDPGCSVEDWECIRSTSLIYTDTPLTDGQAADYYSQGFDFGVHVNTGCANWTPSSLETAYTNDLAAFQAKYTSLPQQTVNRIHCIAWSTYADGARLGAQAGLRQDMNYYYWPGSWVQDRPGFMTGSGMNMRHADLDGTLIDSYQLPTHLVNESGQTFPQNIDTLLDRAIGAEGYYGAFGTHYDYSDSFDRQLVQSAKARGVRLVSAKQMLDWTDARNASYFTNTAWSGSDLTFTATVDNGARSMMRALLPTSSVNGTLQSISKDGSAVSFTTEVMKGVEYAVFPVTSGDFTVTYGQDTTSPTVASVQPADGATDVSTETSIGIVFSEPLDTATVNSTNVQLLDGSTPVASTVTYNSGQNKIVIDPDTSLALNTSFTVQVSTAVSDVSGNALAVAFSSQFTTVANSQSYTLWAPAAQNVSTEVDADVELGLRFTTNASGTITEIHYFRGIDDGASSHTMTLWDSNGNVLGTATTSNESSSGWQTATFASPIAISSGATYTASYRAEAGMYSFTGGGLSTSFNNGPLTALSSGGVYQYGGGYPTSSWNNTNYWIDVTFVN